MGQLSRTRNDAITGPSWAERSHGRDIRTLPGSGTRNTANQRREPMCDRIRSPHPIAVPKPHTARSYTRSPLSDLRPTSRLGIFSSTFLSLDKPLHQELRVSPLCRVSIPDPDCVIRHPPRPMHPWGAVRTGSLARLPTLHCHEPPVTPATRPPPVHYAQQRAPLRRSVCLFLDVLKCLAETAQNGGGAFQMQMGPELG